MTPQLVFDDLRFHIYRGTLLRATGQARTAIYRRDTADLSAQDIEVVLPPTGSQAQMHLYSGHGEGNAKRQEFVASGGIQLNTADGHVVETAEARYVATERLVRGDHPVFIRGPNFGMRGDRFFIEPEAGIVTMQGNLAAVVGTAEAR